MSQHCPGCDGIHYDVAHIDEQGRCDGFDDVDRPGVECEACAEKDAEIADLKALIAKRANVRVSVHEVWLRERKRREAADAENTRLRALVAVGRELVRLLNPLIEQDANDIQSVRLKWRSLDGER